MEASPVQQIFTSVYRTAKLINHVTDGWIQQADQARQHADRVDSDRIDEMVTLMVQNTLIFGDPDE